MNFRPPGRFSAGNTSASLPGWPGAAGFRFVVPAGHKRYANVMPIACLGPRILREELLDKAPPAEALENLKDLVRINRWFGGHIVMRKLLKEFVRPDQSFTAIDVGAASGDMGAEMRKSFPGAYVISLDLKALHLSRAAPPRVAADAFHLPFTDRSVDVVFCSLFLHHFDWGQSVELLRGFGRVARRAVILIDLERHPIPYYFMPATQWLFRWGDLAIHDGKLSVEAAWKPSELLALASEAGFAGVKVARHLPWFRLSLVVPI